MAIRKSIGAKVDQEHFDAIAKFCDEHRITKVELVLDGIAVMMGDHDRVYKRVIELERLLEDRKDYIDSLEGRGFWARLFNKGVENV